MFDNTERECKAEHIGCESYYRRNLRIKTSGWSVVYKSPATMLDLAEGYFSL